MSGRSARTSLAQRLSRDPSKGKLSASVSGWAGRRPNWRVMLLSGVYEGALPFSRLAPRADAPAGGESELTCSGSRRMIHLKKKTPSLLPLYATFAAQTRYFANRHCAMACPYSRQAGSACMQTCMHSNLRPKRAPPMPGQPAPRAPGFAFMHCDRTCMANA